MRYLKNFKLYENSGISQEAEKIANIINSLLFKLKNNDEFSIENEDLKQLNIKKIIIQNNNFLGVDGAFDTSKSKLENDGATLYFKLNNKIKYFNLLHECFHGVDFIYKKGKFNTKLKYFINDNAVGDWHIFFKKNKFAKILYYINDEEVKAFLHSIYSESKYFYNELKNEEKNRESLINFIKSNYDYKWYLYISNVNIYDLIDSISKHKIKALTYAYYNENGENKYTKLLGLIYFYKNLKKHIDMVSDKQINNFKKDIEKQKNKSCKLFFNGIGKIILKIESDK